MERPDPARPAHTKEPRYSPDELAGVVPVDYRKPVDVREVIARIVDDSSEYLDFKGPLWRPHRSAAMARSRARWASSATTGRSTPMARPRPRNSSSSLLPVQHSDRLSAEHDGLHGRPRAEQSRHHQARIEDDPGGGQFHRAADHAAYRRIVRRRQLRHVRAGYDPRFIFAWPNNRIAVMGPEQAAKVMSIVTEGKLKREGKPVDRREAGRDGKASPAAWKARRRLYATAACGRRADRSA